MKLQFFLLITLAIAGYVCYQLSVIYYQLIIKFYESSLIR
jgi:hypothetical protein